MTTNDHMVFALTGTGTKAARIAKSGQYLAAIQMSLAAPPVALTDRVNLFPTVYDNLNNPPGTYDASSIADWYKPTGAANFPMNALSSYAFFDVFTTRLPYYVQGDLYTVADTFSGNVVMSVVRLGSFLTT